MCSPYTLSSICKIFQVPLWPRPDGPGAGAVAERVGLPRVPPRHPRHLPQHVQVDRGDTQLSSAQLQTDLSSTHSLNPNFARSLDNMIFLHASQTENPKSPTAIYTEPTIFPLHWRLDSKANKNLMITLKFKVLLKPTKPDVLGSRRARASKRR